LGGMMSRTQPAAGSAPVTQLHHAPCLSCRVMAPTKLSQSAAAGLPSGGSWLPVKMALIMSQGVKPPAATAAAADKLQALKLLDGDRPLLQPSVRISMPWSGNTTIDTTAAIQTVLKAIYGQGRPG
jgi:hypothetical protein